MGKGKDVGECCAVCGAATFCCFAVIIVLALVGLGIAKIVIGAIYLHDCPIEKMIPIFLIVSGCAPVLFGGLGRRDQDEDQGITSGMICGMIGFLFNLAWLIAGSVWTFPTWSTIHSDSYVPCVGNVTTDCQGTCNDTVLTFSFAIIVIDWVFTGLWIVMIGCMLSRICCK